MTSSPTVSDRRSHDGGTETADVVVVGSGFGGAIAAYHLAVGGAKVVLLERGPWLSGEDFDHDFLLGSSYTRIFDFVVGDGMSVLSGNCVGGGSVVYFAAMPRPPGFIFERQGGRGSRLWPRALTRDELDPWFERVERALPVTTNDWDDVTYSGGLFAAACHRAGHTANPVPTAIDKSRCTNCNWMMAGCRFDAKRSLLFNYLPGALANGAEIRPLHEVQRLARTADGGYRVHYDVVDDVDYRVRPAQGAIDAQLVVLAAGAGATPMILRRSEPELGSMPDAVGKYFSGNGERLNNVIVNEDKASDLLGLGRPDGAAYEAHQIGKGPTVASWDRLDESLPEFSRFALEQLYFPPGFGTVLTQVPDMPSPSWFGVAKKAMLHTWRSWLTVFTMSEDDNEGEFAGVPSRGNAERISQQMLGLGTLRYSPNENTRRGWAESDAAVRAIFEKDGLATVMPWTDEVIGAYTVHPLASCRVGDDPTTSALDDTHELRGHPGIFVTDGSAVPAGVTVNPALTIAALAERAMPGIVAAARRRGVDVEYRGTLPDGTEGVAHRAASPGQRSTMA